MKKLFLPILMSFMLSMTTNAEIVEIDGIYYDVLKKINNAKVTGIRSNYVGAISIPESVEYEGTVCTVTSIANRAFAGCSGLTSLIIPNSVTTIGYDAFQNCNGLTTVKIGSGLTTIEPYRGSGGASYTSPFNGCTALTSITVADDNAIFDSRNNCNAIIETATNKLRVGCKGTVIPNTVTSIADYSFQNSGLNTINIPDWVTSIGNYAFSSCNYLTSLTIGDGVTTISRDAFSSCKNLSSVTIGRNVTIIDVDAFSECSSLTSIVLPNGVTSIGQFSFSSCSSLTSMTLPESVTSIDYGAFSGCSGLTSITIGDGVTSLGNYAFSGCSGLTSMTIGNSLKSIGDQTFLNCSSLTSVTIPNNIRIIGKKAFYNNKHLITITIGSGIAKIDTLAFASCQELTDVYCLAKKVPTANSQAFAGSYINYCSLHVPAEAVDQYKAKVPWNGFKDIEAITEQESEIRDVKNDSMIEYSRFTIDGLQIKQPQRGINIIKMSDGTTKKVVVK